MKKVLVVPAQKDRLDEVIDFVNEQLEAYGCSMKSLTQIDLAVEEIFVNIASYAYTSGIGEAQIEVELFENPLCVTIQFLDNGRPYNPLENEDPDITLAAEDRPIGGLGIFIVKKSMDSIDYEYKDGKNILIIKKNL